MTAAGPASMRATAEEAARYPKRLAIFTAVDTFPSERGHARVAGNWLENNRANDTVARRAGEDLEV
ncbi:hypothetical protein GCM10027089_17140 [Nocardia thraciensis]